MGGDDRLATSSVGFLSAVASSRGVATLRYVMAVIGLFAGVSAFADDCVLERSKSGFCVKEGARIVACAFPVPAVPGLESRNKTQVVVADKATGEWQRQEYVDSESDKDRIPEVAALANVISDKQPLFFNGVNTGLEKNPCGTKRLFGRVTFVFRAAGKTIKVPSTDLGTAWSLIQSGAQMDPY